MKTWKRKPKTKKAPWTRVPGAKVSLPKARKFTYVRRASPKRAKENRQYSAAVKRWLKLPRNRICRVSIKRGTRLVPATQCHHKFGRVGKLLMWKPGWVPVSAENHEWIERNRTEARRLGLLAPLGKWNDQSLAR